ncbi:MAG: DUF4230 domain-containing protein [Prevotella sp.]
MGRIFKWLAASAVNNVQTTLIVILTVVVLIAAVVLVVRCSGSDNHIGMDEDSKVTLSPTQIKSIEDIGEWEFLSIADEELVDTVSHGFFGDDRLVRIYYGTLRLGVNMHEVHSGWLTMDKDTVVATLPPVKLLDTDFIDEARTKSFYEEGDWKQADREAMYKKAYDAMYNRCLTPANIKSAEENAKVQLSNILHSMGFEYVRVNVGERK